jgi:hypothetical protein
MVKGQDGTMVPSMMVRMRCEACITDHRMLVAIDTPLGALPEITKSTFRCNCKRHIPTITKMDKSLMSINGVPFAQLEGLGMMNAPRLVPSGDPR